MLKETIVPVFVAIVAGVILWQLEPLLKPSPEANQNAKKSLQQPDATPARTVDRDVQSSDQRQAQPAAVVSRTPLPQPVLPSLPAPETNQNTKKSLQQPDATPDRTVNHEVQSPDQRHVQQPDAAPIRVASSLLSLDGQWFSTQFRYGFKINGDIGVATQSNSSMYAPGDVILRFKRLSEREFLGEQIFTNGGWNKVSGQLVDANTLTMTGSGHVWTMSRQ